MQHGQGGVAVKALAMLQCGIILIPGRAVTGDAMLAPLKTALRAFHLPMIFPELETAERACLPPRRLFRARR